MERAEGGMPITITPREIFATNKKAGPDRLFIDPVTKPYLCDSLEWRTSFGRCIHRSRRMRLNLPTPACTISFDTSLRSPVSPTNTWTHPSESPRDGRCLPQLDLETDRRQELGGCLRYLGSTTEIGDCSCS